MYWLTRTLRMTDSLYTLVVQDAKRTGRTVNGWIREAIADKLGVVLLEVEGENEVSPLIEETRSTHQSEGAYGRYSD